MSNFTPLNSSSPAPRTLPSNPFARALAETEQNMAQNQADQPDLNNPLNDTLSKTGGAFDFNDYPMANDQAQFGSDQQQAWMDQQAEQEKKRKHDLLRQRLHDQVNPTNTTELFSAREKKVKEEIDKLRSELQLLVKDVAKFDKQVELTLMTEVGSPGQDGKYYITFFQKLRSFIMLLRQKVQSATTWATQLHGKKNKRKSKSGPGLNIGGAAHEKTSTVQDMMHHERSNAYSAG